MSRDKNRDSRQNDNPTSEADKPRDIAEFKKVDRAKILADNSGIENCKVKDEHAGLTYRSVRPDKKRRMESLGYFDRPPDSQGGMAVRMGPIEDTILMACDKTLTDERAAQKAQKRADDKAAMSSKDKGERFAGDGDEIYPGAKMHGQEVESHQEVHKEHPNE